MAGNRIAALFIRNKQTIGILLAIVLVSALTQLYALTTYPVGFHVDEVRIGNSAYSLLQTGKDFWGHVFPLYYDTFGDFRPTGLIYLTIPFIALFGLTEFAVRLPSALFAVLSSMIIMWTVYTWFKKASVALLSGLFLATSPWIIILGRSTSESVPAIFFVLLAFGFWLKAKDTQKHTFLLIGTVFASLSFFFYHSPRIFVPLFFGCSIPLLFSSSRLLRQSILHVAIMILTVSVLVFMVPGGTGRLGQTALIFGPEITGTISRQLQGESPTRILQARFFHNKPLTLAVVFSQNYAKYFTADFLFFAGGLPLRYAVEDYGLLNKALIPLLLLGILKIASEKKAGTFLILFLLFSPIPGAFTHGPQPQVQRAMFLLPGLVTLAALGANSIMTWKQLFWKRLVLVVMLLLFLFDSVLFFHQYMYHRTGLQKNERDLDNTLLAKYIAATYPTTSKRIIIPSQLVPTYEHVLFYTKYNPREFQRLGDVRGKTMWGYRQFTFYQDLCPTIYRDKIGTMDNVFIDSSICKLPEGFADIGTIADTPLDVYFHARIPANALH